MPCNCSNEYCFDKVPEVSIVRRNGEPEYVHLVNVKMPKMKQTLSWTEWIVLCDNCRIDKVGWKWMPDLSPVR